MNILYRTLSTMKKATRPQNLPKVDDLIYYIAKRWLQMLPKLKTKLHFLWFNIKLKPKLMDIQGYAKMSGRLTKSPPM